MRDALYQHEVSLAEDKLRDPERYTRRNKVVRGITRTVGREESKSSVEIKQVAVKSVDANVAHLRATKEMQASTARMSATGAGFGAGASASRSVMPDFDAAGLMPAIATMSSCVNSALAGRDSLKALDPSQPVAVRRCRCCCCCCCRGGGGGGGGCRLPLSLRVGVCVCVYVYVYVSVFVSVSMSVSVSVPAPVSVSVSAPVLDITVSSPPRPPTFSSLTPAARVF